MMTSDNPFVDWQYFGDVNPCYGGYWYKIDQWYSVDIVRVTDGTELGYDMSEPVIVERLTLNLDLSDKRKINERLSIFGMNINNLRGLGKFAIFGILIDCFLAYGDCLDYGAVWIMRQCPEYPFNNKGYGMRQWHDQYYDPTEELKWHAVYNGNITDYVTGELLD